MWFSGCLLAAPTTLFPSILSFPLPSFICVLPIPVFFLCFFSPLSWLAPVHSVNSPCKNRSLSKVYENHNILAFLASWGHSLVNQWSCNCPRGGEKKVWCRMKGANETLKAEGTFGKYGNKKKGKKGERSKNPRSRKGAWRRERWNRKWGIEGGEGGWSNTFWQRWVQYGFMVTSWLIFVRKV